MWEQASPFQHSVHTVGRSMGGWPGKPPNDIKVLLGGGSTTPPHRLVSEHLTMSGVFARVIANVAFRNEVRKAICSVVLYGVGRYSREPSRPVATR